MKLRTALEIYKKEGPYTGAGEASPSGRAIATRVVHLHITPLEIDALLKAWACTPVEKGSFFQAVAAVELRLLAGGYI